MLGTFGQYGPAQDLSDSIAVNCLGVGMLKGKTRNQIRAQLKPFLKPRLTTVHERPIYHGTAKQCGLNTELHDVQDDLWGIVWKLYIRLSYVVRRQAAKIIESSEDSFTSSLPTPNED
jgi:hypothetical protein